MSLSLANTHASLPVAYRLYLPQEWAEDATVAARRGCPMRSASRPSRRSRSINALGVRVGLPRGVVLMDAGYGNNSDLRADIAALGLPMWPAFVEHHGVGARHRATAGEGMVGPRPAAELLRRPASAGLGQGPGA